MKQDNQLTKIETGVIQDEATALIAQAINKGVDVATMEKLLAMRKELRAEKAKEEFDKALSAFQGECPIIEKTKRVSFNTTNYSYAPLEVIVEQVKPLLAKNGFSYMFDTQTNGKMKVICKVKHLAGHMETATFDMEIDQNAKMNVSQKYGSALTYAKRYAFCAAFGINVKDEDTDVSQPQDEQTPVKPQTNPVKATTAPQAGKITPASKPTFTKEKPVSMKQETLILNQLARTGKRLIDMTGGKTAHQSDLTMKEASNVITLLIALPSKAIDPVTKPEAKQPGDELTDSEMEMFTGDPEHL